MGSSGSGSFGNYRGGNISSDIAGQVGSGSGAGSGVGFGGGEIDLPDKIENIKLEDVATSEYYQKHGNLPSKSVAVYLRDTVYQGRLVVETADTHEILGNLPTEYNYLKGKRYRGKIISSGLTPVPYVVVALNG